MQTFAIFVVLVAITVAMKLEESSPNLVGTGELGGFQLPINASLPERKPSLQSGKLSFSCYHVIPTRKERQLDFSDLGNLFLQENLLFFKLSERTAFKTNSFFNISTFSNMDSG